MTGSLIESLYPIKFRAKDASKLGSYLKRRISINLIGLRRVGISNFLRFFLNHKDISKTYINDNKKHLFIVVDLNDLIEREIFPFWTLTFKRIVDSVDKSDLDGHTKKYIERIFLDNIQSKDLFLTIEAIRIALLKIIEGGFLPNIFFLRFDRIKEAVTPEFYSNLQGLKEAANNELAYVFTSFRSLDHLCPKVITKSSLLSFSQEMYIKPGEKEDVKIVYSAYKKKHHLNLSSNLEQAMFDLVDGHVQYLQLALILLEEYKNIKDKKTLLEKLTSDERINLQSEEIWESLTETEQKVLLKLVHKQKISQEEKQQAEYLWDAGLINSQYIFNSLFDYFVKLKEETSSLEEVCDFTKKEYLLFTYLEKNKDQICERESIIETVWPEVEALGVTDWAIDRLIARVRSKLKKQDNNLEIITVRTRGYKLSLGKTIT